MMSSSWQRSGQPRTPRGVVAAAQMGADAPAKLQAGAHAAAVPPTVAVAKTGEDASATGSTEIAPLQAAQLSLPG
jgi:hypothetical protein